MKFLEELISLIKEKKELSPLDDDFVREVLVKEATQFKKDYDSFDQYKRSKHAKELVSAVRKKLRDVYGLFLNTPLSSKRLKKDSDLSVLLSLHKSTQERFPYYVDIYAILFEKLSQMGLKSDFILADIACGYNPLAYSYLPMQPSQYIAIDLSSQDMQGIQTFFDLQGISGEAKAVNVLGTSFEEYIANRTFDVCFFFKALDPFEQVERNSSKRILSSLKSRFIVVSFSLFSIGGKKPISLSKRSWFEKFVKKQGWTYELVQIPNELFYMVDTQK